MIGRAHKVVNLKTKDAGWLAVHSADDSFWCWYAWRSDNPDDWRLMSQDAFEKEFAFIDENEYTYPNTRFSNVKAIAETFANVVKDAKGKKILCVLPVAYANNVHFLIYDDSNVENENRTAVDVLTCQRVYLDNKSVHHNINAKSEMRFITDTLSALSKYYDDMAIFGEGLNVIRVDNKELQDGNTKKEETDKG